MSDEKQLKKLSRSELVDALLAQTEQSEALQKENLALKEALTSAEASLAEAVTEASACKEAFARYGKLMAEEQLREEQEDRLAKKVAQTVLEALGKK